MKLPWAREMKKIEVKDLSKEVETKKDMAVFIPRHKPDPIKEIIDQNEDNSIREADIG